jgi:hypothetical protein
MHRLTINPHHLPTNTPHHRITYTEIETTPHFHHNHNIENPMKETENVSLSLARNPSATSKITIDSESHSITTPLRPSSTHSGNPE